MEELFEELMKLVEKGKRATINVEIKGKTNRKKGVMTY